MTIIDTTLYANGQLRLSRHGADRGGNVLMRTGDGRQIQIDDEDIEAAKQLLDTEQHLYPPEDVFHHVRDRIGRF